MLDKQNNGCENQPQRMYDIYSFQTTLVGLDTTSANC